MPLYEIASDGLISFRQLRGGSELYETEVERLLWDNLGDLVGDVLFPVRRQAAIAGGGRPDIVALDRAGAVVVLEVKRDVDRTQLAQCLEYAGWARTTNLDEFAGLYHAGADSFWSEWQEFTETDQPVRVTRNPRLILVARSYEERTNSALTFLLENGLPITVVTLGLYEDDMGRRFLDVEGVEEPVLTAEGARTKTSGRGQGLGVTLTDLLGAGLLSVGETLTWNRPRVGASYSSVVTESGHLQLPDGRQFGSPSGAAVAAAGRGPFDGWHAWCSPRRNNAYLSTARKQYLDAKWTEHVDDNRDSG